MSLLIKTLELEKTLDPGVSKLKSLGQILPAQQPWSNPAKHF